MRRSEGLASDRTQTARKTRGEEMHMAKQVTCPLCGGTVTGENDDALVAAADKHGDEQHGMRAPREMILSSATEV
ncbi:MAG: hypothetical protein NVS2B8_19900 [Vulcanimicrobiaceae bacterium]